MASSPVPGGFAEPVGFWWYLEGFLFLFLLMFMLFPVIVLAMVGRDPLGLWEDCDWC